MDRVDEWIVEYQLDKCGGVTDAKGVGCGECGRPCPAQHGPQVSPDA